MDHRSEHHQSQHQQEEAYNRLFILGGKGCSEDQWRQAFEAYGQIKDVWIVKDRNSGDEKGICYITFSKASEAALAIEEMNGRLLSGNPKPLKVLLANNRREGNVRDPKEEERMLRIFIMIPKTFTEDDVRKEFECYGDIDYIRLLRDKNSKSPKGLAFVKYFRAYHAARALEECNPSFKAVFAYAPQQDKKRGQEAYGEYEVGHGSYERFDDFERGIRPVSRSHDVALEMVSNFPSVGPRRLELVCPFNVSETHLRRLLDVAPGFEHCHLKYDTNTVIASYCSSAAAAYAYEKLNGLEYPPGCPLQVRMATFEESRFMDPSSRTFMSSASSECGESVHPGVSGMDASGMELIASALKGQENSGNHSSATSIQALVESLNKATNIIHQAGLSSMLTNPRPVDEKYVSVTYCNVRLPERKPFASRDSPIEERLFIVSQPNAFPENILRDAFVRFGGLVDAYFMPGRNFGYVKYALRESAHQAIQVLHGQSICNNRVKVILSDPPKNADDSPEGKRPRMS